MQQALAGLKVLDLSRYIAGPYCTTILGDMGAEIIRVETRGGTDDRFQGPPNPIGDNFRYMLMSRNKKSITLDLERDKGKALFRRLVAWCDVVVENYSPPVKRKLGLTYEALKEIRPDVILASGSAFGANGPDAERLGFDHIAQAETGVMDFNGFDTHPPLRSQINWVDFGTALHSTIGILLAVIHRMKTGEGQWVETALLDTAGAFVGFQGVVAEYQVLGTLRPRLGNASYHAYADTFTTKDGGTIMLAIIADPLWRRLAKTIGHPELSDDPRCVGDTPRYENRHFINPLVQAWIGARTKAEVLAVMKENRIPCGDVRTVREMMDDPQTEARAIFENLPVNGKADLAHPRIPVQLSKTPGRISFTTAAPGEHNEEIFCDHLGLSREEYEVLLAEGVI